MLSLNKQRGFSLLELMVSLALGIVLLLIVASLYITATKQDKKRSVQDDLQSEARVIFQKLLTDIEHSGYVDVFDSSDVPFSKNTLNLSDKNIARIYTRIQDDSGKTEDSPIGQLSNNKTFPVFGCINGMQNSPKFAVSAICDNNAKNIGQESIQISYQSVSNSGNSSLRTAIQENAAYTGSSTNTGAVDCTGSSIGASEKGFVINRYFISNVNGVSQLQCVGNGSGKNTTPIANNVRELTFQYALTPENPAGTLMEDIENGSTVINYVKANNVSNWNDVVGVRVCIVLGSGKNNSGSEDREIAALQKVIPSCIVNGGSQRPPGDTNFYQKFVYNINMPNTLYLSPVSFK